MADYSGVALLIIGANVFLNALWLQDKVAAKDVAIINLIAANILPEQQLVSFSCL